MGWVKLDDTFDEHPKVALAGDEAAWLYVAALLYSYRANTDGFVPTAKVVKLTNFRSPLKLAQRLVEARLWHEAENGYHIHDYLSHQQSAAEREEQRQANVERLRKHRAKKQRSNGDETPVKRVTNTVSNGAVMPPEGEGEGELPPSIPPLSGGRQRSKEARQQWVRSLAEQFEDVDRAEGLIWAAVSAGAKTAEDVRRFVVSA